MSPAETVAETAVMPRVRNKYHGDAPDGAVFIGRPGPYGNAFVIGRDGDREEVIAKHRAQLLDDVDGTLDHMLKQLRGKDLICFCAPAPCHGDTLIELANAPACGCCGSSSLVIEVDVTSGLCLGCQACPTCGRSGTTCTDFTCAPWVVHVQGDLLTYPGLDAIAHGVNCQGVMGAGIAKAIRDRWPAIFEPYRARCADGRLRPGKGFVFCTDEPGIARIYNLATQDQPGPDARLEAIEESLSGALRHARAQQVRAFGIPRLGSGIGGLAWADVAQVVERVAAAEQVPVVVVTP